VLPDSSGIETFFFTTSVPATAERVALGVRRQCPNLADNEDPPTLGGSTHRETQAGSTNESERWTANADEGRADVVGFISHPDPGDRKKRPANTIDCEGVSVAISIKARLGSTGIAQVGAPEGSPRHFTIAASTVVGARFDVVC